MTRLKDFGDRAQGRVCTDDDQFHLARPARVVAGVVSAVYPYEEINRLAWEAAGDE